jgi:hypothetical protein
MNTFTAQDMKEYAAYSTKAFALNTEANFKNWCKERFEPTKKVIDLSVLIDSQIDCTHDLTDGYGPLDNSWTEEALCEARVVPRTKYKHAWDGGECPLPEGFIVHVWFRSGLDDVRETTSGNRLMWTCDDLPSDIIHFQVLRVADGYVMPWGVSDE